MKEKSFNKLGIFLKVLIACILAVGLGGFGVALALSNVYVAFSGTFHFDATAVEANVEIEAYQVSLNNASTSTKIGETSDNISRDDKGNITTATLKIPSLDFGDSTKNKLEILIYITNSNNQNFWVKMEDNSTCSKVALTKTWARGYEGESSTTEETKASENEKYENETTFYQTGKAQTDRSNNTIRIKITAETKVSTEELNKSEDHIDMQISLLIEEPELTEPDVKLATDYENLKFTLNDSGNGVTVKKKDTTTTTGDIVIPARVAMVDTETDTTTCYDVTTIGTNAFTSCSGITSIYIPSTVTTISSMAFRKCTSLTSISIPASVTTIGRYVFRGCENLEQITVDSKNKKYTSYENGIYSGTTLVIGCKTTVIKDDTTTIGANAFKYCTGLTEIRIPLSVTKIEAWAFNNSGLTLAYFDNPFKWNGYGYDSATGEYSELKDDNIYSETWDTTFGDPSVVAGMLKQNTSLEYRCDQWSTDDSSLANTYAYNWNSIDFTVNDSDNTAKITGLNVNGSHTSIGKLFIPERIVKYDSEKKEYKYYTVTEIGENAFQTNNTTLTAIYLPRTITSIPANAFNGCTSLETVYLPDSITNIGENAFSGCTALASVENIENLSKLTYIGYRAFYGCTGLTQITIPENVITIGKGAFANSGLTSTTFANISDWRVSQYSYSVSLSASDLSTNATRLKTTYSSKKWTRAIHYSNYSQLSFIFPSTSEAVVSSAIDSQDKKLATGIVEIPEYVKGDIYIYSVTRIAPNGFASSGVTKMILPSSITNIGDNAFSGCTALASVENIENLSNLTYIGYRAFYGCTGLTQITIPSSVTEIGDRAFKGCSNIAITFDDASFATNTTGTYNSSTDWTVGDTLISLTSLGDAADNAEYLTSTYTSRIWYKGLDYKVTYTANTTDNCTTVAKSDSTSGEIDISAINSFIYSGMSYDVTTIADNGFENCSGMTSIKLPDSLTTIGGNAFNSCTGMISITIPVNVSSIRNTAFKSTTSLEKIEVDSENNTYTGYSNAIYTLSDFTLIVGCKGTTEINSGCKKIGDNAFYKCTGLGSITIPVFVTSVGVSAFQNCTGLTSITFSGTSKLTSIGESAFQNIGLPSITIPSSVNYIGANGLKNAVKSNGSLYFGDYNGWSVNGQFIDLNQNNTINYFNNSIFANQEWHHVKTQDLEILVPVLNSDGKYSVKAGSEFSKVAGTSYVSEGKFTIPSKFYYNGNYYDITGISDNGFNGKLNDVGQIKKIEMESTVKTIGAEAFANNIGLCYVTIPDSVYLIGENAFRNCLGLLQVNNMINSTWFEKGVADNDCDIIYNKANYGYKICISDSAWAKYFKTGNGELRYGAFETNSFRGQCKFTLYDNGSYATAQKKNDNISGVVVVPGWINFGTKYYTMTEIRDFSKAKQITGIRIPYTLKFISSTAFLQCSKLTSISWRNVDSYGLLVSVTSNKYYEIYDNAIYEKIYYKAYKPVLAIKLVEVDKTVSRIDFTTEKSDPIYGYVLLIGCNGTGSIKSGTIGIEKNAFRDIQAEIIITIPSSVWWIGAGAFANTPNFTIKDEYDYKWMRSTYLVDMGDTGLSLTLLHLLSYYGLTTISAKQNKFEEALRYVKDDQYCYILIRSGTVFLPGISWRSIYNNGTY